MRFLKENLKFLRQKNNLTQDKLANILGVKRATVGTYEDGRAEPRLETLDKICKHFEINYEELLNKDLSKYTKTKLNSPLTGQKLKILTIAVDKDNNEFITYVPVKASAGYLDGYGDTEYISSLPTFSMPFPEISSFRTYRAFEIQGNSMLPIKPGTYILSEFISEISDIRDGQTYILLTKEDGIVYKRVKFLKEKPGLIELRSDNKDFQPYIIQLNNIYEIWKAIGYICFELPIISEETKSLTELTNMVQNLQTEINNIKKNS